MILLVNFDGTPYAVKVARTVWSGGKSGDCIKGLPIAIDGGWQLIQEPYTDIGGHFVYKFGCSLIGERA